VAFQADKGLGLGGKFHQIEERRRIAFPVKPVIGFRIIFNLGYGKTPRSMARLAIYQRQTVFRLDLFAVDTMPEVISEFGMFVASGNTIVGSHILRIQPADDHPFILADREYGPALLQIGTAGER
jgi:hypothetical protein